MKTLMTRNEIEACRTIGRDEVNRRSTISLPELDALCDTALAGAEAYRAFNEAKIKAAALAKLTEEERRVLGV